MEFFNDEERRMFLRAMARERVVCEEADRNYPQEESLTSICDSIVKKVNQAVSVRHGHWIVSNKSSWSQCSVCKRHFLYVWDYENADERCRHCGAKMDEPMEMKDEQID